MILLNVFVCYAYCYYVLAFFNFCLYLSTITHWQKVKHDGIERKIDVCCVVSTFSHATYVSFTLPQMYTYKWLISLSTCITIFYINEKLFYYQVLQYKNKKQDEILCVPFHYFSMKCTKPHTFERELAYYRNVITHGLGLHTFLCIVSMYCVINNPLHT